MNTLNLKDEIAKPRKVALYMWTDIGVLLGSVSVGFSLGEVDFCTYDENYNRLPEGQQREITYPSRVRISEIVELPPLTPVSDDDVVAGLVAALNEREQQILRELNEKLAEIRSHKAQLLALTHQSDAESQS